MGPDDKLVLTAIGLGTLALAAYLLRSGARGRPLAAGLAAGFLGVALVAMLAAHCAEIAYNTAVGNRGFDGTPFRYDWRVYSLELFGVLLIALGVRVVGAALRLARGEPLARMALLRPALLVLALVLPIIPIHPPFGYLVTVLTLLCTGLVGLIAREPAPVRSGDAGTAERVVQRG